jgi:hypothetical protein
MIQPAILGRSSTDQAPPTLRLQCHTHPRWIDLVVVAVVVVVVVVG